MALNMTHPSPLEDDRLEYRLHLTSDLLPEMEELLLPGPLQEEINIQVREKKCLINELILHFSTKLTHDTLQLYEEKHSCHMRKE